VWLGGVLGAIGSGGLRVSDRGGAGVTFCKSSAIFIVVDDAQHPERTEPTKKRTSHKKKHSRKLNPIRFRTDQAYKVTTQETKPTTNVAVGGCGRIVPGCSAVASRIQSKELTKAHNPDQRTNSGHPRDPSTITAPKRRPITRQPLRRLWFSRVGATQIGFM